MACDLAFHRNPQATRQHMFGRRSVSTSRNTASIMTGPKPVPNRGSNVLPASQPRPIRWPVLPRVAWTSWQGGVHAFYCRCLRASVAGCIGVAAHLTAAAFAGRTWFACWPAAALTMAGVLAVVT
jgi:hypothetical protein